jgi:hypothetical protein
MRNDNKKENIILKNNMNMFNNLFINFIEKMHIHFPEESNLHKFKSVAMLNKTLGTKLGKILVKEYNSFSKEYEEHILNHNEEFVKNISPKFKFTKLLNLEKMFNELHGVHKENLWQYLEQLHKLSNIILC